MNREAKSFPGGCQGHTINVRAEDVPDCGPLEILHEISFEHIAQYAPEIVGGIAFCAVADQTRGCMVVALELATGTVKWKTGTDDWMAVSPIPLRDTVIVGTDLGRVYCLRQSDGRVVWLHENPEFNDYSADGIWSLAVCPSRVLAGTLDGDLYCLDSGTGKLCWKLDHPGGSADMACANPVIWHDSVLFCPTEYALFCLDMDSGQERWRLRLPGGAIDDHMNQLLIADLLYVPSYIGGVFAVDLATRQLAWKWEKGEYSRTPVALGDALYYPDDDDGSLYGAPLRPVGTLSPEPFIRLRTGHREPWELPDISTHKGRLYYPAGRWLYVLEPSPVDSVPSECSIRKYSSPEPFMTGLAHDGDLFCAATTTNKFLIGRIPDLPGTETSHSR